MPLKAQKPPRRRSGPFRKVVPAQETRIGVLLLASLAAILGFLVWKSGNHDRTPFQAVSPEPRADGLLNTILEIPRETLIGSGVERAPHQAARSDLEDLAGRLPAELADLAVAPGTMPELFPEERLFEKINGRAELFVQHGVVGLVCATYREKGAEGGADLYLYLMKSELAAFGVFSAERPDGAAEAGLGQESHQHGEAAFFRQGPVYAQVVAFGGLPEELTVRLARELAERLPPAAEPEILAARLQRLPEEGQVPGTLRFEPAAAFGFDALSRVFYAKYTQGEGAPPAFLWYHQGETAESARAIHDGFLGSLGRLAERLPEPGSEDLADATFFRLGGRISCIFRWDELLGGVMDARDRASCEELLERLMVSLEESEGSLEQEGKHW